jgi:hypothetical protein
MEQHTLLSSIKSLQRAALERYTKKSIEKIESQSKCVKLFMIIKLQKHLVIVKMTLA